MVLDIGSLFFSSLAISLVASLLFFLYALTLPSTVMFFWIFAFFLLKVVGMEKVLFPLSLQQAFIDLSDFIMTLTFASFGWAPVNSVFSFFPPRCHVFLILWCSYCFCLDSFQLIFSEICWRLGTASCWKLYQPQVEQNCCFMILTYVPLYIPLWYLPLSQQRIFQFLKLALN